MLPDEGSSVFRIAIRVVGKQNIGDPGSIWQRVMEIFDAFCSSSANSFTRSSALWVEQPLRANDLRNYELAVYLVPDVSNSLIRRAYPDVFQRSPPGPNDGGLTAVGGRSGNLSEVYTGRFDEPTRIGETI